MAPADAIMGLNEAFRADSNPKKVNLTIGVYMNERGVTPIFDAVKQAEKRLIEEEATKSYLPIPGQPAYGARVRELLFGKGSEVVNSGTAVTAHTPGGTGALRIAADLLKEIRPGATVWLSEPTWPNHPSIFEAADLTVRTYRYYDAANKSLDFDGMMQDLAQASAGEIVVLHACCHNPTGMDPDAGQWAAIRDLVRERQALPFFDFAYQGLGDGLEADALGMRAFIESGQELLVASSFSKNFGLYSERTGALTLMAEDRDAAERAFSHLKRAVRSNYSNPPSHGAGIVTTILNDVALRRAWEQELSAMCERINTVRTQFVEGLAAQGVQEDFSFLSKQKGMFSFSGLNAAQVDRLREEFGIYMVRSGRINVAGINDSNLGYLCESIAAVLA
jgi:aspartate/tyrosine/aromatic aminotransferase